MTKKFTSLILSVVLIAACFMVSSTTLSETGNINLPVYEAASSGSCGSGVTWAYNSETKTLTISGSGKISNYSSTSKAPWNLFSYEIETVTIGRSVTSIGSYAFSGLSKLKTLTVPAKVTSIGTYAFDGCSKLEEITIPAGVTAIQSYSFNNCIELKTVTMLGSVTSIGTYAFYNCYNLGEITLPSTLTTIGAYAFYNCYNLGEITLPSTLTTIGASAFYNCYSIFSITIPDSVTSIGAYAFYLNGNVSHTASMAATGSPWGARCVNGYIDGDFIYNDSSKSILYACNTQHEDDVVIPEETVTIGAYAFYHCTGIINLTVSQGVESVGGNAFAYCSGLKNVVWNSEKINKLSSSPFANSGVSSNLAVTIGDSVETIPSNLFKANSNVKSIQFGENVKSIGDNAFYNCNGISELTIPDNVESIGSCAFYGLYKANEVTIPDGVTSIGSNAFYAVKSLSYSDNMTASGSPWGALMVNGVNYCGNNLTWNYDETEALLTVSGTGDMYDFTSGSSPWKKLNYKTLVIESGVTSIGSYAFYGCDSLNKVTIPDTVNSIGAYAFSNCGYISAINWNAKSVASFLNSPVFNNAGTSGDGIALIFGDTVESLPYGLFSSTSFFSYYTYRSKVVSVSFGSSVKSIGGNAFYGCSYLTVLQYRGSISDWCDISFDNEYSNPLYYCKSLKIDGNTVTELIIPDGITTINPFSIL